jgi:hypothetical protein
MYSSISLFIDNHFVHPVPMSNTQMAVLCLGLLLVLAFEVWMLVDVLALRKVPTNSRVAWVVGMFLIHPFVALAYLLVRSRYKLVK